MAAILIVEDDLTFATMLKTWLGKQGFQISTAGDLQRFLSVPTVLPSSVVITVSATSLPVHWHGDSWRKIL